MPGAADPLQELLQRVGQVARDSQELLRELVASEHRFRALAKSVWQVQEEERRRLALELHDGLGQDLTALKNQLELLRGEVGGASERLAGAVELAARALQDTRELSRLLRTPILDDLGLPAALSWLARTLGESTGLEVRCASQGVDERLPPELEILVFRVAQEALTNVLKHSGAKAAALVLRRRDGWLELEVSDAGSGFDAARALAPGQGAQGFGLRGMRDRLELFGGRLRILSAPGQGTRLRAAVPLPGLPTERAASVESAQGDPPAPVPGAHPAGRAEKS